MLFCVRYGLTEYLSRGRTQVEAGSRTVLGIGPGKSPVMSCVIILIILYIPAQHR
jgi:peptidyl-tRNA hydrolase